MPDKFTSPRSTHALTHSHTLPLEWHAKRKYATLAPATTTSISLHHPQILSDTIFSDNRRFRTHKYTPIHQPKPLPGLACCTWSHASLPTLSRSPTFCHSNNTLKSFNLHFCEHLCAASKVRSRQEGRTLTPHTPPPMTQISTEAPSTCTSGHSLPHSRSRFSPLTKDTGVVCHDKSRFHRMCGRK